MKRVGIIGYGAIGKFIADNLQEDPGADLRLAYRRSLEGCINYGYPGFFDQE